MKWYKVYALMYRDFEIFMRSKWRIVEFFYFPITTVLMWGLFALYSREFSSEAGLMILTINIFWSFAYLAQSTVNMQMNEDTWSGSLKQILASGVSEMEYMLARVISSTIISSIIMAIMLAMTYAFGFSVIFAHFDALLALILITLIASMATAIIVGACIIGLGREYNFLAWTAMQTLILFSSPFYPVEILPQWLQSVAYTMPFTYVFIAVRELINLGTVSLSLFAMSFASAVAYLIISLPIYKYSYLRAKKTGKLARM